MASKPRSRKRNAPPKPQPEHLAPEALATATDISPPPLSDKNVSAFEGTLSIYAGLLLLAAGLFPRTFRQVLLLTLGAAFLHRGQNRHCYVYEAAGIDTNKGRGLP